jgi:hypothetical protein
MSATQSHAEDAKARVQDTAQQAAGEARGRLRDQLDQRSTQAGEQVSSTAGDIRTVADQLREQGKDQPAKLAHQAADRVERVGGYLERADGEQLLHDLEDIGRRQPWAVMAGGLAAGFLASRFLKASSSRRYEQRYATGGAPRTPATGATGAAHPRAASPAPPVAAPAPTAPARPIPPEPTAGDGTDGAPARNVSLSGGVLPEDSPGTARPVPTRPI